MKYKVACRYRIADKGSKYFYKSNDLPTVQWMEDNIGESLVDWICHVGPSDGLGYRVLIEFKEEDKLVMFLLKCGDNIEQV